jgi:molybdopterin converting factor small subunit
MEWTILCRSRQREISQTRKQGCDFVGSSFRAVMVSGTGGWPAPALVEHAPMRVLIPSPLRSYTTEREVEATGGTLAAVLADLDRQYPGLRFRMIDEQGHMRPHIRFFVNGEQAFDLQLSLRDGDEVQIVKALSGGR